MASRLLISIVFLALAACGNSVATTGGTGGGGNQDGGSGGGASFGGGSGGAGGGASGSGGGGGATSWDGGCPDEAKTVYVVDADRTFSAFDPKTGTFRDIGQLACPAAAAATPFSMAVDRGATAWVLYSSGELFKVSTATLTCVKTAFGNAMFKNFGMGFSTDAVNGTADSLFIAGGTTVGASSTLARLDLASLQPASLGTLSGSPELTGTGDAKLWGFFPSTGAAAPFVAQLNKTDGTFAQNFPAPSIDGAPKSWAFAFWGGRFWIFLKRMTDGSTFVYEMNATTGVLTTALPDTGRQIVGAGVSTCAPVEIN